MKRKSSKVILSGLILLVMVLPGHAAEKIAFLDAQKILDETKAGQRAKTTMQEYRDSRQKIIDLDENELTRLQEELARQEAVLSLEAKRERQENLQRKLGDYQKTVADMSRELESKKRDILEEFNRGMLDVVKKIAKKEGYSFVFDRNDEGGALLYADESFDITGQVIKEYDAGTQ